MSGFFSDLLERLMVDSPEVALEGSRLAVIGHIGAVDRPTLVTALNGQAVIDLAGVGELRNRPDIAYRGICW